MGEAGPDRLRQAAWDDDRGCGQDPPAGAGKRRAAAGQCDFTDGLGFFRGRARPPLTAVIACIDAHRGQFGVGPACKVLTDAGVAIAPGTYYAAGSRPPSAPGTAGCAAA